MPHQVQRTHSSSHCSHLHNYFSAMKQNSLLLLKYNLNNILRFLIVMFQKSQGVWKLWHILYNLIKMVSKTTLNADFHHLHFSGISSSPPMQTDREVNVRVMLLCWLTVAALVLHTALIAHSDWPCATLALSDSSKVDVDGVAAGSCLWILAADSVTWCCRDVAAFTVEFLQSSSRF